MDPGNAEDGYVGSGEPATARDPMEVLGAITPLGCRPGQLPVPTHALEVTYARDDLPGVGMLLRFDDEATAAQFFDAHTGVISDCVGRRTVEIAVDPGRAGGVHQHPHRAAGPDADMGRGSGSARHRGSARRRRR